MYCLILRNTIKMCLNKKITMKVKYIMLIIACHLFFFVDCIAQKDMRSFIFGHSLIHHEFQVNPTPSQETSVPHWFYLLAVEADHTYAVGGQYGFLPQHANLPPFSQWGFDLVPGAWDSDNDPFAAAGFNNILITPGNFIQWQPPSENYPNENLSPLSATQTIFDWCIEQEEELNFYVYENWPDMAGFLNNDFPPSASEWEAYNSYLNGDFHNWFLEYYDALESSFPDACIRMIPVGPVISQLLMQSPYNQIPVSALYEDDAPHGQATIYFLAALTTYMTMYEEKAPSDYQVPAIIHPLVVDNYQAIVDIIWEALNEFENQDGMSMAFCAAPVTTAVRILPEDEVKLILSPNPAKEYLIIDGNFDAHHVEIYDGTGRSRFSLQRMDQMNNRIKVSHLPNGVYHLVGRKGKQKILYRKQILIAR